MYAWQTMELSRHAAMQVFSAWKLKDHETPWRRERSGGDAFRRLPREQGGQLDSKHCVDTSGRWIWWGTGDHWWVEDSYQSIAPTLVLVLSGVSFCQYPSCNTVDVLEPILTDHFFRMSLIGSWDSRSYGSMPFAARAWHWNLPWMRRLGRPGFLVFCKIQLPEL